MSKVKEYDSYAVITSYLHRNEGEAYVKAYTGVNEDPRIDASKDAECISKVKVTMHVEEDRSVKKDGSFYEKTVGMTQERDAQVNSTAGRPSPVSPPIAQPTQGVGMDKVDYLKNMHDQLDNRENANTIQNQRDHTTLWVVIVALAILIGLALGFGWFG